MPVKKGDRRGRYSKKQECPAEPLTREEVRAEVERRAVVYLDAAKKKLERPRQLGDAEPPERDWTGALSAARQLAALELHHEDQTARAVMHQGTAEESARLASLSRELRHLRAELGIALYKPDGKTSEPEAPL